MSESAQEQSEQAVPPNRFVERSPIILGAVGAVIALVPLIGLAPPLLIGAHAALSWFSLGLGLLGLLALARGRRNAWTIVAIVLAVGGFVFWAAAPETIGELPVYAYLLTAVGMIGTGLLVGRVDPARQRGVYIACAGAVVFTIVTAASRLGF